MKTQLIMITNQPILVNVNVIEGINPEVTYFDDKVDSNGIYRGVEFGTNKPIYNIILGINENRRVVKEIIAGISELPSIDFSALSEEDCKKIGWVDVEKLAYNTAFKFLGTNEQVPYLSYLITESIKTAQSLNKKKFSEEDIRTAFGLGAANHANEKPSLHECIQSLSQPKVFDVEVEMELNALGSNGNWFKPKITNNSIKILKVL